MRRTPAGLERRHVPRLALHADHEADRLRDGGADGADRVEVGQRRREQDVGAGRFVGLQARDRVGEVGRAAEVVLGARGDREAGERQLARGPNRGDDARRRELDRIERRALVAAVVLDRGADDAGRAGAAGSSRRPPRARGRSRSRGRPRPAGRSPRRRARDGPAPRRARARRPCGRGRRRQRRSTSPGPRSRAEASSCAEPASKALAMTKAPGPSCRARRRAALSAWEEVMRSDRSRFVAARWLSRRAPNGRARRARGWRRRPPAERCRGRPRRRRSGRARCRTSYSRTLPR